MASALFVVLLILILLALLGGGWSYSARGYWGFSPLALLLVLLLALWLLGYVRP